MIPDNLKYNESHEWAIQNIVHVELPQVGTELTQKTEFGVIESVKAAFNLYAPVSGKVIAVNESLLDAPRTGQSISVR